DKVKTGLGYKATSPAVESFVNSSEMLENQKNIKSISDKGYHAVPPPYTGNYIPPKLDLMFIDEQVKSESVDVVSNVASSDVKTVESKHESVDVKNKGVYNTVETTPENIKSISDKGYHAVPPPYTGNYIPPKLDLMFIDEQVKSESVDVVSNVASSDVKTVESKHESVDVKNKGVYNTVETTPVRKNSFSPPIIKD
nr:hypothetical protein [Tanacetum cinerariifolium]